MNDLLVLYYNNVNGDLVLPELILLLETLLQVAVLRCLGHERIDTRRSKSPHWWDPALE